MEFNEKLQELRKQKGLTQEELAGLLYVSRTAISKWESGRGFPSIESLKSISRFFSVSLDDLLSGEELITIAEHDHKEKERTLRDLVFGLLDCGAALLFFLPFFGQTANTAVQEVSLFNLTEIPPYLKAAYWSAVSALTLLGVLTLALQNRALPHWIKSKTHLSLVCEIAAICLFVISQQPYAALFLLLFFLIKVFLLIKPR